MALKSVQEKNTDDVRNVMAATDPDAVVLELCPARLVTLRSAVRKTSPTGRVSTALGKRKRRPFSQVRDTFKGTPQAILATLLESVYSLQALSGLDPGIEFAHPIRTMPLDQLICGDAPAADTVQGLYRAFTSPRQSLRIARELIAKLPSFFQPPRGGINVLSVVVGSPARMQEIVRLLIPTSLVAVLISFLGSAAAGAAAHTLEGTSIASTFSTQATGVATLPLALLVGLNLAQTVFLFYAAISAFHFMKVLISDRDTILAKSILDSAAYYSKRQNKPVTIVTVVGLLHVNGILCALQEAAETHNVV